MASRILSCALLLTAASLAGCASSRDRSGAETSTTAPSAGQSTAGVRLDPDGADLRALPPGVRSALVYFAFDSDAIDAEGQRTIEGWARYLTTSAAVSVRLEGHADERGTAEYNVGLGERRALAVRRALMNLGVPADRLSAISYGESRPAVQGSDESAWSQNRRVEVVR